MIFIEPWNIHEHIHIFQSIVNVNLIARNEKSRMPNKRSFRESLWIRQLSFHCWEKHNESVAFATNVNFLVCSPLSLQAWTMTCLKLQTQMSFWVLFQSDGGLEIIIQPQNNIITNLCYNAQSHRMHVYFLRSYWHHENLPFTFTEI